MVLTVRNLGKRCVCFQRDSFSETVLKSTDQQIRQFYQGKGYYDPQVSHRMEKKSGKEVVIYFEIELGQAPRIRNINFEGNTAFADAVLLDLMKTQPRSRFVVPGFGWLLSRGIYNPAILEIDKRALELFYKKEGYPDVRVTSDDAEIDDDNRLILHIKISEGEQKIIDRVSIEGVTIFKTIDLYPKLGAKPATPYSLDKANDDERQLKSFTIRRDIFMRVSATSISRRHAHLSIRLLRAFNRSSVKSSSMGMGKLNCMFCSENLKISAWLKERCLTRNAYLRSLGDVYRPQVFLQRLKLKHLTDMLKIQRLLMLM